MVSHLSRDTDDLRESPFIKTIKYLLRHNKNIFIYDDDIIPAKLERCE